MLKRLRQWFMLSILLDHLEQSMTMPSDTITVGELDFDVRLAGPSDGPLVILLHGFPETSHMWLPLIDAMAASGYRVAAPDQRGYSAGARPEGAEHYAYPVMANDVTGLADALGAERFHLVGHDHGAGLGWFVLGQAASRIISWSALSVPHIDAFAAAITNNPEQAERSQYMTFFREQGVAEDAMSANDFEALKNAWNKSSPEQVEEYLRVFRQPGAVTGALNWYRGGQFSDEPRPDIGPISTPTLFIWGNQDNAIGRPGVEAGHKLMTGDYEFIELDAGHWLIQEQEEKVVTAVANHINKYQ